MNAPKLQLVRTREQTIEEALQALTSVMVDTSIDTNTRHACRVAWRSLHDCRSPATKARMEREIFNRLSPEDQELFLRSGGKV